MKKCDFQENALSWALISDRIRCDRQTDKELKKCVGSRAALTHARTGVAVGSRREPLLPIPKPHKNGSRFREFVRANAPPHSNKLGRSLFLNYVCGPS